jgi:serine/threonine protein kinase HipA of HipAB toxin-antitoxin module
MTKNDVLNQIQAGSMPIQNYFVNQNGQVDFSIQDPGSATVLQKNEKVLDHVSESEIARKKGASPIINEFTGSHAAVYTKVLKLN